MAVDADIEAKLKLAERLDQRRRIIYAATLEWDRAERELGLLGDFSPPKTAKIRDHLLANPEKYPAYLRYWITFRALGL